MSDRRIYYVTVSNYNFLEMLNPPFINLLLNSIENQELENILNDSLLEAEYIKKRDKNIKADLHTVSFNKSMKCDDNECSICKENFKPRIRICNLPCNHIFHSRCIKKWARLGDSPSCPVCRSSIPLINNNL